MNYSNPQINLNITKRKTTGITASWCDATGSTYSTTCAPKPQIQNACSFTGQITCRGNCHRTKDVLRNVSKNATCGPFLAPDSNKPTVKNHPWDNWEIWTLNGYWTIWSIIDIKEVKNITIVLFSLKNKLIKTYS